MLSKILIISLVLFGGCGGPSGLDVGDLAPDFALTGSDGKTHRLSDFKGKQAVVIAWFPKAFTGGCTKQCKSFSANGTELRKFNVAYFTASCDPLEAKKGNANFAKSLDADYPILSDPSKETAKKYGVSLIMAALKYAIVCPCTPLHHLARGNFAFNFLYLFSALGSS